MSPDSPTAFGRLDWACIAVLAVASALVFAAAPLDGDFIWSESPRNALNGAFALDLLREMPRSPVAWAEAYYLKYPALTILFYPPMLAGALVPFFAVLGVSHWAAMVCMTVFLFALGVATYAWARRWSSPPAALAAALLLLSAPEVLQWGQQVMLEIPMLAFTTTGALLLARYGGSAKPRDLALATVLLMCAAYTKQTAAFVVVGLGLGLVVWQGPGILRRRHIWVIMAVAMVALVPLLLMQIRFGSFNVTSVVHRPDSEEPGRWSVHALTWYAVRLPGMAGWPLFALALAGLAVVVARARSWRSEALLVLGWLGVTYAALSLISLKETRHGVPLLLPLAILAAVPLGRATSRLGQRTGLAHAALPLAAAGVFAASLHLTSAIGITGYREAADRIGALAPPAARVAFAGNRDGSFIFNVRALTRQDITVLRVDKLFLGINIMPGLGLNPRDLSAAEVAAMLNRYGVSYVVTVPQIWVEAPVMAHFDQVLRSDQFEEVARIPVTGPAEERELVVYRNKGRLTDPPEQPTVKIPAAQITLGG